MAKPQVDVIIPTLNEARRLPGLLADLRQQAGVHLSLIVVDGGSRDATAEIARAADAAVLHSPPGRGQQMNLGHARAKAPWRLFLHADSRLPEMHQLQQAIALMAHHHPAHSAGHWPLRFTDAPEGHARLFQFLEAKSRSGRPGTIHGDQGLLIHRRFLDALGGFDARLPFFEDVRLSQAVFARGRWLLLPGVIETSARRFVSEGVWPRYGMMGLMMLMDAAGDAHYLREVPSLYRPQADAEALSTWPLAALAARRLAARPDRWPTVARFLLANRWQLPLALRCAMSRERHPHSARAC